MRPLKALILPSLCIAPTLLLSACQGIQSTPVGSPRVEIELIVEVDGAFYKELDKSADRKAIARIVSDSVESLADVGFRFYPVRTERYGKGQQKPTYLMHVEAKSLEAERSVTLIEGEDQEEARIESELKRITCTMNAVIEKRRSKGPPLPVGTAVGTSKVSILTSTEEPAPEGVTFELKRGANESNTLGILQESLEDAVSKATEDALSQLQEAIDRELSMMASKHGQPTAK